MKSPILATSLKIGNTIVKNRIAVPAMADFGMTKSDGFINERHLSRYGSYATGGAGLIMKDQKQQILCCDDGVRPVVFLLEKIAQEE